MNPHRQRPRGYSSNKNRRSKLSVPLITHKQTTDSKKLIPRVFDTQQQNRLPYIVRKTLPVISASNWCLYDSNNGQLIGFRETLQREVASLTKIMTTMVSLNLIARYRLDTQIAIRVSRTAASLIGTSAQLKYSKWLKLQDLLYGAMLPSGNDAAYLLSEIFGLLLFYQRMKSSETDYTDIESIDLTLYDNTTPFVNRFLKEMNRTAKQLKLRKTNYTNPHGLSNPMNTSSAKDILQLSKYACKNKQFIKIMNTKQYLCNFYQSDLLTISETRVWKNLNKLLTKGWEGIKTGQTVSAGSCLASTRNGVFIVVLNCSSLENRFIETELIYDCYNRVLLETCRGS